MPARTGSSARLRSRSSPRSYSRRASSPTTKKKNVIRPLFTQSSRLCETDALPRRIESTVLQTRSYDDRSTLAQTSAAATAARISAALPVSVLRKSRSGVRSVRRGVWPVSASAFTGRFSLAAGSAALEDHDGDRAPRRRLLVLGELWEGRLLRSPDPLALVLVRHPRPHVSLLRAELDLRVGIRNDVVVPVGVRRRTALRGEHGDRAVAEVLVHQRVDAFGAGLRPLVVQKDHRRPLEHAADLPAVRAELLDDLLVEILHVTHVSDPTRRPRG